MEKKRVSGSFVVAIIEGVFLLLLIGLILLGILYYTFKQNKYVGVYEYTYKESDSSSKTKIQLKIEKNNKITVYMANYANNAWISEEEKEGTYFISNGWMSIEVHDEEEDFDYIWVNFPLQEEIICYSYNCKNVFEKTDLKDIEKETIVETNRDDSTTTSELTQFQEITGSSIASLSKNKTIVVLIGRENCRWCLRFAPIFADVTKEYGVEPYYIDLTKILDFSSESFQVLDEKSYQSVVSLKGEGEWSTFASEHFGATPQVLIIKDNQVIGGQSGYSEANQFSNTLENAGFKKR